MGRKRILWLASWYPNRYDKFNGDFIQRHAQAASIDNDIYVIHLQDASDISSTEKEVYHHQDLTEQIIYYRKGRGILGKALKQIRYFIIYKNAIKAYIREYGLPHCIHVHVPWKAGLMALWVKRRYGVKYVVTEHWGIYNNIVEDKFSSKPLYFRKLIGLIFKDSMKLITVSAFIGRFINDYVTRKEFVFVPNVVNTQVFNYSDQKNQRFTFLHVSNMVELKNVDGILEAFHILLSQERIDVQLVLVGNQNNYYERKAMEMGIPFENIVFKGEVQYDVVGKEMQRSHCLILNSIIENSPCVIGEALCCGIPVIATTVGGIPELVTKDNSILIESRNTDNLVKAMKSIYLNYHVYNGKIISEVARAWFDFRTISKQLDNVYGKIRK